MNLFLHSSRLLLPPDQSDLHGGQPRPRDGERSHLQRVRRALTVRRGGGGLLLSLEILPFLKEGVFCLLAAGLVISPSGLGPNIF